jgi:hypothetical protein
MSCPIAVPSLARHMVLGGIFNTGTVFKFAFEKKIMTEYHFET